MTELKQICVPIQDELIALEEFFKSKVNSKVPLVKNVIDYIIGNGGKRLRPMLTIMCAKLAGYQGDKSIAVGAAIEMTHTASLLHDDVMDNAEIRRGKTAANQKWGNLVSVLVGDYLYCQAMDILVANGDIEILRVVTDAISSTTEGQIHEITKTHQVAMDQVEYLEVITGKTAELIAASCHAGGVLGNITDELASSLKEYGLNLGIAFQLMDDVLDYVANEKDFGKACGVDLREGKLTIPLILALRKCSEEESRKIKSILIKDNTDEDAFNEVLEIIKNYHSIDDSVEIANEYIQKAKASLSCFRPSLEKESLISLADYVIERNN
jgi:octaprenyl-diphosphate synthase